MQLDLAYLGAMGAFALWNLRRLGEAPDRWVDLTLLVGAAAGAAAFVGGPGLFGVLRLQSWGLFAILPAWCLAAAWVCRPESIPRAVALAGTGALLAAVGIDAFLIEPRALQLTRYEVRTPELDEPVRIALIADLQTDRPGAYERSALELALEQAPDLLLFAGDYVQEYDEPRWRAQASKLKRIFAEVGLDAPLGGFAVQGNVDPDGLWPELFEGTGVRAVHDSETFSAGDVTVTALSFDDGYDGEVDLPEATGFHIALGHYPDFARGPIPADLLVAGHTHGGQVRVPLAQLPILTFSHLPRAMAAGRTDLDDGRVLIVSRGIGMERMDAPRLRFNCPPEVVIIDVVPAE